MRWGEGKLHPGPCLNWTQGWGPRVSTANLSLTVRGCGWATASLHFTSTKTVVRREGKEFSESSDKFMVLPGVTSPGDLPFCLC